MELIFRIQDKKGRGPFKPGFSHKWVEMREDHQNLKSFIEEFDHIDYEMLPPSNYGAGCRTIDQLKRWFTKSEYKKLIKAGYRAVKIKINKIIAESDTQVFFSRDKALKRDTIRFNLYDNQ